MSKNPMQGDISRMPTIVQREYLQRKYGVASDGEIIARIASIRGKAKPTIAEETELFELDAFSHANM